MLLVVGGGVAFGLAKVGIVNIPPISPAKRKRVMPDDGKGGPFAVALATSASLFQRAEESTAREAAVAPPPPPVPKIDPGPGEAKLAGLWASLPTDRLVALVAKWPEPELGRILAKMDEDAAAKLLGALPPPRAASLSRALANATDEKAAQKMKKDSQ